LAEGPLAGNIVTCPLHGWRADVTSGESLEMPGVMVSTFEVKVEDGKVFIKV
jgi:nitrite reductase (NADH) small subunit